MPEQAIRAGVQIQTPTASVRDRLEAFESRDRATAVTEYPELQRAYTIEDASKRFADKFIKDATYRAKFERITKDYIRDHLLRDESLPELARQREELAGERDRRQQERSR